MIRVFVVSPSPAVRAGLRSLLAGEAGPTTTAGMPAVTVVGEAHDLDAVGDGLGPDPFGGPFDVLLFDARAHDADDMVELAASRPALRAVILGPVESDDALAAAFRGRAWGYLGRDAAGETLAAAVRAVAEGLSVLDPALATRWPLVSPAGAAVGTVAAGEELTSREREVLQLVAGGLPNKTIAQRLGISEHTVKFHVAAVLGKLGAASRAEAVRLGARRGDVVL